MNAKTELLREALRFAVWAAGEGICPLDASVRGPEDFLMDYSVETDDDDWETLADRILAPGHLDPYTIERCAEVAEDDDGHFRQWGQDSNSRVAQQTCNDIAAAIRALKGDG